MSLAPLFITNNAALLAQLRLTATQATDAIAIIDSAISEARVWFYDELGVARVGVLVALTATVPPVTANDILRSKAALAEGLKIRAILLRRLPVLFMDSSAETAQAWNQEGLTRNMSSRAIQTEIDSINEQLVEWMEDLAGGLPEDSGQVNASILGPDASVTPITPFCTVNPTNPLASWGGS